MTENTSTATTTTTPTTPPPESQRSPAQANEFINELLARAERTAAEKAVAVARAEMEVREFVQGIKSDAEVAVMEPFITRSVEVEMANRISRGEISDISQYAQVYKEVVAAEVEKARNIARQMRAAGKTEAQTVKEEALAASPVPTEQKPQVAEHEPMDYFKWRMSRYNSSRGIK